MERDTMIRSSLATALAAIVAAGLSSAQPAFAEYCRAPPAGAARYTLLSEGTFARRINTRNDSRQWPRCIGTEGLLTGAGTEAPAARLPRWGPRESPQPDPPVRPPGPLA